MRRLTVAAVIALAVFHLNAIAAFADGGAGGRFGDEFEAGGSLTGDGAEAHASRTSAEDRPAAHRPSGTVRCTYYDDGSGEEFDPGSVDASADWDNGILIARICVDTSTGEQVSFDDGLTWTPRQPDIDPRALAEMQVKQLSVPVAEVGTSPTSDQDQVVRVPTWLWIASDWQPVTVTATAGRVAATVTATPTRVVWSMGDGGSVTCAGPGTPYDSSRPAADQHTDCSYTYRQTSVGQPDERYSVTATVYWSVVFTSNAGANGALGEVSSTSAFTLRVAQAQALNQ
jgi:hypothetical protein